MEKLVIYEYQAKQIEDTLRMVSNLLNSKLKTTSLDRDVMQSWGMIKAILEKNPDKEIHR